VDPFYRILFHDGSTFDYVGDDERCSRRSRRSSRATWTATAGWRAHAQRIFEVGYEQLADRRSRGRRTCCACCRR
jgi:phytoene desaturase